MALGELPNFERFYNEAEVHETEADERAPNLEPWIQWITVHTGIPYRDHGIQRLGDGHELNEPSLWDEEGRERVGVRLDEHQLPIRTDAGRGARGGRRLRVAKPDAP
jgi:hypothetical protein